MKKIAATFLAVLAAVTFSAGTAFAWTYTLTGSGTCQPDGSYKITWNINNPENEILTVQSSSNTTVVPVGSTVPVNSNKDFVQTADGKLPGSFTLTTGVNWPSDTSIHSQTATVTLAAACTQPTPPPAAPVTPPQTGGKGGDETVATVAKAKVTKPQVVVPVGAVNAGYGGATQQSPAAIAGLLTSLVALGFGLRMFVKQRQ
jgi:hypothetical protein